MRLAMILLVALCLAAPAAAQGLPDSAAGQAVDYPIVYVRAPASSDPQIPEIKDPVECEPGTDLVLRMPDGSERVLVEGGKGAVMDPYPTFDGQWVLYAYNYDVARRTNIYPDHPYYGSDIFKVHVQTGEIVQLTHQEFTPSTVVPWYTSRDEQPPDGQWYKFERNSTTAGVYNLGPCPLPDGRFMFTSSRNGWAPTKSYTWPAMQLFVADLADGKNVEQIDFRSFGSALHPTVLSDGRVMFSSYESQGKRDRRVWSLWEILPDGRDWMSLLYENREFAWHWQTETSDRHIAAIHYYNQNNWGFGWLLGFPLDLPDGETGFSSPDEKANGGIRTGLGTDREWWAWWPFKRYGLFSYTPWSLPDDQSAGISTTTGERVGKVTQPAGAPDGILVTYSPGGVNAQPRPAFDAPKAGIYLIPDNKPTTDPSQLVKVIDRPEYNEQQARPLLPYKAIYGVDEPATKPWLPPSDHPMLPEGSPFGLVGSSTVYLRETNTPPTPGDTTEYTGDDVAYIRYLIQQPNLDIKVGPDKSQGFWVGGENKGQPNERTWILADVPVRNDGHTDPQGHTDTSHLVRLPANVSWMQQLLNADKEVLTTSWTWKQVRPGETITKCGGCHYHSKPGLPFETTFAATELYEIHDLTKAQPKLVDWSDIKPIIQEKCLECHSGEEPAGGLVIDNKIADSAYVNRMSAVTSELYKRVKGTSTGSRMPLDGDWLTDEELELVAAWIDTGAGYGSKVEQWTTKPTLHVARPRRKPTEPVGEVLVGAFAYGGVTVDVRAPVGVELVSQEDGVYRYSLAEPMTEGDITVTATDTHGNVQRIVRSFEVVEGQEPPTDPDDELQEEIDRLKELIAGLEAENAQQQAKIDAAKAYIDEAQKALE